MYCECYYSIMLIYVDQVKTAVTLIPSSVLTGKIFLRTCFRLYHSFSIVSVSFPKYLDEDIIGQD